MSRIFPARFICLLSATLCCHSGCFSEEKEMTLVKPNPFGNPDPVPGRSRSSFTQPSVETAARVDTLGRTLLAKNAQIGLKPTFEAIGDPRPEIFHRGMDRIIVTEGVVRQCRSEAELAAVLCHELGKMVSEREALAGSAVRAPERQAPMNVPVGNDSSGTFGAPDGTRLAELAKYGPKRPAQAAPPLPPQPDALARNYLTKAGYSPADLDAVAPLLQAAEKNSAWEKQMNRGTPARPWTQ